MSLRRLWFILSNTSWDHGSPLIGTAQRKAKQLLKTPAPAITNKSATISHGTRLCDCLYWEMHLPNCCVLIDAAEITATKSKPGKIDLMDFNILLHGVEFPSAP